MTAPRRTRAKCTPRYRMPSEQQLAESLSLWLAKGNEHLAAAIRALPLFRVAMSGLEGMGP